MQGCQTLLLQEAGPLPKSVDFKAPGTGPGVVVISGSVWSPNTNKLIGIQVELDGTSVGTAEIYSNGGSTHRTVVTSYMQIELNKAWPGAPPEPPTYTLTLENLNADTTSDINDRFTVALLG